MSELPFLLEAGILLLFVFVINYIFFKLKVPSVLGYLVAGVLLGILVDPGEDLRHFAEIGVVLLFFMLGMDFPVNRLASMAGQVWTAGVLDLFLNFVITASIAALFGLSLLETLIIGGICYASSSSIIIRLLEDAKRIANPEAEYILGILIFEDLAAPLLVAVLAGLAHGVSPTLETFGLLIIKIFVFVAAAILIAVKVFRNLKVFFERFAGEEFVSLLLLAVALGYAGLAVYMGLSEVLGAFLAGLMLAETQANEELEPAVLPLRDITLPLFFLVFATGLDITSGIPLPWLLAAVGIWSILGKIVTGVIGSRKYNLTSRAKWRAGFSLVPRGEFSVIIAGLTGGLLGVWGGIYTILLASAGVVIFHFSPRLAGYFSRTALKSENLES